MQDTKTTKDSPAGTGRSSHIISIDRLIKGDLRIVEPMQMEASFQYRLMIKGQDQQIYYPQRYQIDSYLIFPAQMRISPASYPIESFYRDLKSFINFRIPKLSFKEIMGLTDNHDRSPLKKIKEELGEEILNHPERIAFIQQEARVFACSFYTFINRKNKRLLRQIEKLKRSWTSNSEDRILLEGQLDRTFNDNFTKINQVFQEWRKIFEACTSRDIHFAERLRPIDEYIMYNIHDYLLNVERALYDVRVQGESNSNWLERSRIGLRGLRIYTKKHGYNWIDDKSDERDLENYFFHRGTLKRQVWSALYLDTRTKPLFKFQQQAGAMLAAGFAGAWAVMADIMIRLKTGLWSLSSTSLGYSTFLVVTALTMTYILKDRIKELGRGYFRGGLFGDMPDNSSKIVYQSSAQKQSLHIGYHDEKVSYVDTNRIPEELADILKTAGGERWEQEYHSIIRYRKRVELSGRRIHVLKRKIRAIYTFYRLNISNFIAPLDLPYEEMLVPTRRLDSTSRLFPKVYHIDLILKMTVRINNKDESTFQFWRLVINKAGLKRIDPIPLKGIPLIPEEDFIEDEPLSSIEALSDIRAIR